MPRSRLDSRSGGNRSGIHFSIRLYDPKGFLIDDVEADGDDESLCSWKWTWSGGLHGVYTDGKEVGDAKIDPCKCG